MIITEETIRHIIHDLIRIVKIINTTEEGSNSLSEGEKQIIRGCEIRLMEIRQELLSSVKEEEEGEKNDNSNKDNI